MRGYLFEVKDTFSLVIHLLGVGHPILSNFWKIALKNFYILIDANI